jgi:hypothetical protein
MDSFEGEALMPDKPDFVHETGARAYAGCILLFFGVVWVAAVALAFAFDFPRWWAVCWVAAATLTVAIVAGQLIPVLVRGGTHRLIIQDGWLRADSPHPVLGPSFAVALSTITKLVVRPCSDGPDAYEVHTSGGETLPLSEALGPWVFQAIHQLHPEVPIERSGQGEKAPQGKGVQPSD